MGCLKLPYHQKEDENFFHGLWKKSDRSEKSYKYYPFGLQTSNSWTRENSTQNNYLYNDGNELNQTSGWYEMFYRGYDPALGRMLQVDPYAASYSSHTPYNYSMNNPVTFNDPSGAIPEGPYDRNGQWNEDKWRKMQDYQMWLQDGGAAMMAHNMGGGGGTNSAMMGEYFDALYAAAGFNNTCNCGGWGGSESNSGGEGSFEDLLQEILDNWDNIPEGPYNSGYIIVNPDYANPNQTQGGMLAYMNQTPYVISFGGDEQTQEEWGYGLDITFGLQAGFDILGWLGFDANVVNAELYSTGENSNDGKVNVKNSAGITVPGYGIEVGQSQNIDKKHGEYRSTDYNTYTSNTYIGAVTHTTETDILGNQNQSISIPILTFKFFIGLELYQTKIPK